MQFRVWLNYNGRGAVALLGANGALTGKTAYRIDCTALRWG